MSREHLLPPETLEQLSGLELKARGIVEGYLAGLHRSPHRGFSVEFAEHREYAAGDDLRYVDWKVYGKRDRYYLKQFEEESNFVCHLLIDVSPSMSYRSDASDHSKLGYARRVAAALACLILRQQDAVGLMTFDSQVRQTVPPAGQPAHLKQIIRALEATADAPFPPDGTHEADHAASFARPLHLAAERIAQRSLLVILSDFFGDPAEIVAALKHCRHRRHDVSLLHVIDPDEQTFPFDDPLLFRDMERIHAEFVDARAIRAAYCREFETYRRRLEAAARDLGMDYALLRTDAPLDAALAAYLVRRSRRTAGRAGGPSRGGFSPKTQPAGGP